jgi:anaerobic dimethyl sulfoxide reductase subunit B (iron-sulfur subunit)
MAYTFTFDASACSGCKACQEACKDKNGLPVGILWRRVIEVSGGEWHSRGSAWENNVYAYNLTLACNHCTHPKCAGVCPTEAYSVRPDGIVLLDQSKCMGCGYCAWACPYGAPQYDPLQGVMTKCDFCYDNLDAGLPPNCVSACPLRVLNCGALKDPGTFKGGQDLWLLPASQHPYPLPEYSRTEPHLSIKPHPGMNNPLDKTVSNREEILPPGSFENDQGGAFTHELPLVAFTLLAQMSVGIALCGVIVPSLPIQLQLVMGILLVMGISISFLHLGRKRNAWRSVIHLKKSWLSREILMSGLFGITWAATTSWQWLRGGAIAHWPTAILGIGIVYCMARVYHLRAVPGWNSWRTTVAFFLSTIVLGALATSLFMPDQRLFLITELAMAAELAIALTGSPASGVIMKRLSIALLALGIIGALLLAIFPHLLGLWLVALVFIIAMAEESLGRWQFYLQMTPFPNRSR